ncbi:C2 calcium-dependent domain-containing protein 4C-like [Gopherus evgoodei]|uniref:C2 calcium-dependent domain-containing protein 4C-like n=1 Tax=Gopherus evgoodei TaxID=1825980 RepID=UPI0011CF40BA|nr:C2 calcium-dependent domain-containing protein 4C-like [Gopherus evgoodei]
MWCLEKLSKASEPIVLGKEEVCFWNRARKAMVASPNILTPDRIPEFCIPSRLISSHSARDPSSHIQSYAETNLYPHCEPDHNPSTQLPHILSTEIVNNFISVEESTNSDPQSQAALSLLHFPKVQTSYGFCTLLESPHTRRKESIFHSDPCSCSMSCLLLLPSSRICYKGVDSSIISSTATRLPSWHPHLPRQDTYDYDTASSYSLFTIQSREGLLCRALKAENKSSMLRENSLSTDEDSSTDNSSNPNRWSLASLCECSSTQSSSGSQSPIFPQDFTNGRERLRNAHTVFLDRRGILRLSSDYCPESRRLRLCLISAEGLYDVFMEPKRINCCITFCLVPGKVQKQRSTIIKRSRNPIFNEDFVFDGISKDDLHRRSIKIKAVNKASTMKRDYILGKIELCLLSMVPI